MENRLRGEFAQNITQHCKDIVYCVYRPFAECIRSSKLLMRALFGLTIPCYITGPLWDFTTLVLKKALDMYIHDGHCVLEIGTGKIAVLSAYIAIKKNVDVLCVDIIPTFVPTARQTVKINRIPNVSVIQSNLFENVSGYFDVIFFNSVYIPTEWGLKHRFIAAENISKMGYDLAWHGGETGCETIIRFLEEVTVVMKSNSKVLLGVNTFYVSNSQIKTLVAQCSLKLNQVISCQFNPSKVYVLSQDKVL